LVVVWIAASGCALHRQQAGSNPFVKPGKPPVEMGEPLKIAKASRTAPRADSHPRPASSVNMVPTVETSDPALSSALLKLAIAPTAEAHRAVAEQYRELGILDMSYDHLLKATQLNRADAAAYEGLARIWRDWGFPQLGVADASRAVFYAPASASAHSTLGTLLAALGHDAEARREYERAVELDPGAAYALNNLCYLSFVERDDAQAIGECRAALAIDPTLEAARTTLAQLERRNAADRGHR
jgi:tetratricopeptide (TPR) repeat protein